MYLCVAPLLTVRCVKTTDATRHFAACASALGTEMTCCTSVVVRLSSKLEMPPVAAVIASSEISTKTIVWVACLFFPALWVRGI